MLHVAWWFALVPGFFEAIKQNYSRESKVPVEAVSIKFDDTAHFEKELKVSHNYDG